ncbi:MAG: hypothetical protein ACT4P7_12835 [Gemmatimonadaceae bacterium]
MRDTLLAVAALSVSSCADPIASERLERRIEPSAARVQWSPPTWTTTILGTLPGKSNSVAHDISDNGVIVGEATTSTGALPLPFRGTQAAGLVALPMPGGVAGAVQGRALAISDNGLYIAGNAKLSDGRTTPLRWTLGSVVTFTMIGCPLSSDYWEGGTGWGVNNAGTVVGSSAGGAWSWTLGTTCPSPVDVVGTTMSYALDINDIGTIVGFGFTPSAGFFKSISFAKPLSPLPGHQEASAHAVDDANGVVGRSDGPGPVYTAVYWNTSLAAPIPLGPAEPVAYLAMSDQGRIVWPTTTGGMTLRGTTTHALAISPRGVNKCGDIVGASRRGLAVLMKKTTCDLRRAQPPRTP